MTKRLGWFCVGLVWSTTASAQPFRYQFQDQPYSEANVIIVEYKVVPGESSQWLLEGRVFNRGVKPAKNVRVVYTMWRSGARMPANPIYLSPGEVPATSFANFRERLPQVTDPHDLYVTVTVEWDQ